MNVSTMTAPLQTTPYKQIELDPKKSREERTIEGCAAWASFYRENPHRFAKDYLGINLKRFQQILLLMMDRFNYLAYIAARGQGKSFLVAVFCCVRCILYPGEKICIAAGKRSQSINILEYIQNQLAPASKNLANEIKKITINQSDASCHFWNTSYIKVVTAADSARGNRANIVINDEFRMIPEDTVTTVINKFLSDERHPPYADNPEYAGRVERNKQIYLTSAWFQDHWSYKKVVDFYGRMMEGKSYFVCGLPYQLSILEGLYRAEQAEDEMSEATFNEAQWEREMECKWTGDTDGSFFASEAINRARKLKYPALPNSLSSRFGGKQLGIPQKQPGELRLISVDIALMRSAKKAENDATSIFINFMTPNQHGRYYHNFMYSESHEGETTQKQALRIRRLYAEYSADYIVIDGKGAGAGIVDLLLDDIYDPDTGETYGALSCYNNPEFAARCTDSEAPKALWICCVVTSFCTRGITRRLIWWTAVVPGPPQLLRLQRREVLMWRRFRLSSLAPAGRRSRVSYLAILVYACYEMHIQGNLDSLYAVVGICATMAPIIWGYYSKSKAENTEGGIVYEMAMAQVGSSSGEDDGECFETSEDPGEDDESAAVG